MARSGRIYEFSFENTFVKRDVRFSISTQGFSGIAPRLIGQCVDMDAPSTDTGSGRILIVDSSGEAQLALTQPLVANGYTVFSAVTPEDIYPLIHHGAITLILLEINVANLDSIDLCHRLKQSPHTRHLPILFLGDGHNQDDRLRAFQAGGGDFIPKPYWAAEIVARIRFQTSLESCQPRWIHGTSSVAERTENSLLATLQRTLHQQTIKLREQNTQLQKEVRERQQAEKALRHEQQKSEQLLLNILPEAIVEQLMRFQGSLAQRFDEATVLFADIVNFTPMAAQMSPLQLVDLLNRVFSAFDRLVEKYQLEKIKTIGDAYMVVGGVPVPAEGHAAAIADMALEMQRVAQQFTDPLGQPLQLRIGMNTGTVVAGVIGIKKFSYDLWGDTVNVASRMESQGTPGKVQVTEATYRYLTDDFLLEPAREMLIKGKGKMPTYYLLGRR